MTYRTDSEAGEGNFDAMVDACITAGEAVMEHGSERLQGLMKLFLLELGSEVAQRAQSDELIRPSFPGDQ